MLVACSGTGGSKAIYHPDVGPFDENGDYVEALADAPVRKNIFSRGRKPKEVEPAKPPKVKRVVKATPPPPAPTQAAPPRRVVIAQSPRTAPRTAPRPVPTPRPVAAPRPAPKPKAVVVKPKKKAPLRHIVRKSDTLYGLSRKYGVSVGAIQRANGLRGTTIVTGKSLLIPR